MWIRIILFKRSTLTFRQRPPPLLALSTYFPAFGTFMVSAKGIIFRKFNGFSFVIYYMYFMKFRTFHLLKHDILVNEKQFFFREKVPNKYVRRSNMFQGTFCDFPSKMRRMFWKYADIFRKHIPDSIYECSINISKWPWTYRVTSYTWPCVYLVGL